MRGRRGREPEVLAGEECQIELANEQTGRCVGGRPSFFSLIGPGEPELSEGHR